MASEFEEIEGTIEGASRTAIMLPEHEPTPRIEWEPAPDGDGSVGVVKVSRDTWEVVRQSGPREYAARHRMSDLGSFAAWLRAWHEGESAATVFAALPRNPQGAATLSATVNPRDPGGDRIAADLAFDPTFEAWAQACGALDGDRSKGWMGQRDFFTFVREFGDAIVGTRAREGLLAALSALRIVGSSSLEVGLAENGRVKVAGARNGIEITQELPAELQIETSIYLDDTLARFEIRIVLEVEANADGIRVRPSMPGIERTFVEANGSLRDRLADELGKGFLVCGGLLLVELELASPNRRREGQRTPPASTE